MSRRPPTRAGSGSSWVSKRRAIFPALHAQDVAQFACREVLLDSSWHVKFSMGSIYI